jgi:hypothetical protein
VRALAERGVIRAGDVVVLEDAGDHRGNPEEYEANWILVRRALADTDARVVMMTIYSAPVAGEGCLDVSLCTYDLASEGFSRSHNDATVSAARLPINGKTAMLLDLNALLRRFEAAAPPAGAPTLLRDGIHPNLWGQCLLALSVARAADLQIESFPTMRALLRENFAALSNTSRPTPATVQRSDELVDACVSAARSEGAERR